LRKYIFGKTCFQASVVDPIQSARSSADRYTKNKMTSNKCTKVKSFQFKITNKHEHLQPAGKSK